MKIKKVPFFANTPDDTHCYQAAIRSVLKYFLPNKDYSWKKLDKLTGKKEGKWTWPLKAMIELKRMGFDVVNMEDFDYERLANDEGKYLLYKYGKEVGQAQINNSDIKQERKFAKKFVEFFGNPKKLPKIDDIKSLVNKGYLVCANVNSRALNNKKGYVGHFVIIFGYDKEGLLLHDPGLPPLKNRKVSLKRFMKAWAYPDSGLQNLQAFKYTNPA